MPKVTLPDGSVLVGGKAEEYLRAQKKAEKEAKKSGAPVKAEGPPKKKAGQTDADFLQETSLASLAAGAAGFSTVTLSHALDWDHVEEERLGNAAHRRSHGMTGASVRKDHPLFVALVDGEKKVFEVHADILKSKSALKTIEAGAQVVVQHVDEGYITRLARVQIVSADSTKAGCGGKGEGKMRPVEEHVYHNLIVAVLPSASAGGQ